MVPYQHTKHILLLAASKTSIMLTMMRFFAFTAKMTTVYTLLAVASAQSWSIFQVTVKNTFLCGDISKGIYMLPPDGLPHSRE